MAKCSVCGAPAVITLRSQRRSLCSEHLIEYVESRVEKVLRKARVRGGSLILAAISGGKDSATMLAALSRLSSRMGFRVIALHIDLGIGEYSRRSREASLSLTKMLDVPLVIIDLKEAIGATIPELARGSRRPVCGVCGLVKRYVINAAAVELGASYAALGHNADDIAAYALKSFLTQDLEYIAKLGPYTESIEGLAVGRLRPLYEISEKESFVYAVVNKLPFYHEECPNVDPEQLEVQLKEHISRLEQSKPGIRLGLLKRMSKRLSEYPSVEAEAKACRHCGLLASAEECSFCRLTQRVLGKPLGLKLRNYIRFRISAIKA